MAPVKGIFRVGTSNIVVPGNKQTFPLDFQSRSRLCYYATLFNSLEINRSFYKVPLPSTFEKWANDVPGDFQFTVKLWKGITHVKQLAYDPRDIDSFMAAIDRLGKKKGCLLVQFPASITIDYTTQLRKMLQRLKKNDPKSSWRMAVEFRHSSWYTHATNELLNKYEASLVLHDMPKSKPPAVNPEASFINLRFHGMKGDYRDSYPKDFLEEKAKEIKNWLKQGKDVYAYFNNTIGDAFGNARELQRLLM